MRTKWGRKGPIIPNAAFEGQRPDPIPARAKANPPREGCKALLGGNERRPRQGLERCNLNHEGRDGEME